MIAALLAMAAPARAARGDIRVKLEAWAILIAANFFMAFVILLNAWL